MLSQASAARSGNERYSPAVDNTPAFTTLTAAGSICAQRTQFTVPPPGLQAMAWVIQT